MQQLRRCMEFACNFQSSWKQDKQFKSKTWNKTLQVEFVFSNWLQLESCDLSLTQMKKTYCLDPSLYRLTDVVNNILSVAQRSRKSQKKKKKNPVCD